MKSGNLNFLEPSGPLQACNGIDLPLLGGILSWQGVGEQNYSEKTFSFTVSTTNPAWTDLVGGTQFFQILG
jgi:hypothetical protein